MHAAFAPRTLLSQVRELRVTARCSAGALLDCSGPQCHVTLKDVTLHGCRLSVEQGARAELHGGRLHALLPETVGRNLCQAMHTGSTVSARDTTFDGRVGAFQGASFTGDRVHVTLGTQDDVGVMADGEGSSVVLRGADIARTPGIPSGLAGRSGVYACSAAVAELSDCTIKQLEVGVAVVSGGRARLRACHVDAHGDGVWAAGEDSGVEGVGGRIRGGKSAVAMAMDVSPDNVSFEDCKLGRTRKFALTDA